MRVIRSQETLDRRRSVARQIKIMRENHRAMINGLKRAGIIDDGGNLTEHGIKMEHSYRNGFSGVLKSPDDA